MKTRYLADIIELTQTGEPFSYVLANWLDDFNDTPSQATLLQPPPLLNETFQDAKILNAYIAAVASQLCKRYGWPIPSWTWDPERILPTPWFAEPHPFLRATLLLESPSSFRERNLFVSANVLSRV